MARKSWLVFLSVLIMAFVFALAGIVPETRSADKPKLVRLLIGGGLPGGAKQVVLTGVAEAIKRGNPNYSLTYITSDTDTIMRMMNQGRADLGTVYAHVAKEVQRNEKLIGEIIRMRALLPVGIMQSQIFAKRSLGITSISDMIKKKKPLRIGFGPVGSNNEIGSRWLLKAYGITYDDIKSWGGSVRFTGSGAGTRMMADGLMDVYFHLYSVPHPRFVELGRSTNLILWPIAEESVIKKMEGAGMEKSVIPAGGYKFLDRDLPTLEVIDFLVIRPEIPNDVAYGICKAMYENIEFLKTVHVVFGKVLKPELLPRIRKSVAFHPGAEKYYKEKGWLE